MAKANKKTYKTNDEKIGNYAKFFNDRVIAYAKDNNKLPWQRGWNTVATAWMNHISATTTKAYKYFLNQLALTMSAEENGYKSNKWITKGQILKHKGASFKGSPTWIFGWFYWEKVQTDKNGKVLKDKDGNDVVKSGYNFTQYMVYNTDQCTGLPDNLASDEVIEDVADYVPLEGRLDHVEEYISNIGAKVEFGKNGAYYRPSTDTIGMPDFESFHSVELYYSTFMHEHIHWTKTEDRCKRKDNHANRKAYAFEELVAEMGAVYTMNKLGVPMDEKAFDNHLAYVDNWLGALEKDPKFLVDASMLADKSVKFLDSLQNKEDIKKVA